MEATETSTLEILNKYVRIPLDFVSLWKIYSHLESGRFVGQSANIYSAISENQNELFVDRLCRTITAYLTSSASSITLRRRYLLSIFINPPEVNDPEFQN